MQSEQTVSTQQSYSESSPPRKDADALTASRVVLEDVFGPIASIQVVRDGIAFSKIGAGPPK